MDAAEVSREADLHHALAALALRPMLARLKRFRPHSHRRKAQAVPAELLQVEPAPVMLGRPAVAKELRRPREDREGLAEEADAD